MSKIKTFLEYVNESDAPTNTTGANIANPDARPLFKRSKFHGKECLEVDCDVYDKLTKGLGKVPFDRWSNYIEDESLRNEIRKSYQRHKKVMLKNATTGAYTQLK